MTFEQDVVMTDPDSFIRALFLSQTVVPKTCTLWGLLVAQNIVKQKNKNIFGIVGISVRRGCHNRLLRRKKTQRRPRFPLRPQTLQKSDIFTEIKAQTV